MSAPGLRVRLRVVNRNVDCQRVVACAAYALHNVQLFSVRMAVIIEPSFIVKTDGVNDECISLPLANRVSHPCRIQILGMLTPIGVNLAHKVIVLIEHDHLAGGLHDLHRLASYQINPWHTWGKQLVIGSFVSAKVTALGPTLGLAALNFASAQGVIGGLSL